MAVQWLGWAPEKPNPFGQMVGQAAETAPQFYFADRQAKRRDALAERQMSLNEQALIPEVLGMLSQIEDPEVRMKIANEILPQMGINIPPEALAGLEMSSTKTYAPSSPSSMYTDIVLGAGFGAQFGRIDPNYPEEASWAAATAHAARVGKEPLEYAPTRSYLIQYYTSRDKPLPKDLGGTATRGELGAGSVTAPEGESPYVSALSALYTGLTGKTGKGAEIAAGVGKAIDAASRAVKGAGGAIKKDPALAQEGGGKLKGFVGRALRGGQDWTQEAVGASIPLEDIAIAASDAASGMFLHDPRGLPDVLQGAGFERDPEEAQRDRARYAAEHPYWTSFSAPVGHAIKDAARGSFSGIVTAPEQIDAAIENKDPLGALGLRIVPGSPVASLSNLLRPGMVPQPGPSIPTGQDYAWGFRNTNLINPYDLQRYLEATNQQPSRTVSGRIIEKR